MDLELTTVAFDCRDPLALAGFWCAVTGYEIEQEPGEDLSEARWITTSGSDDEIELAFQRVPEPKIAKNRVHLDFYTDDVEGEVARCIDLGARRLWDSEEPDDVFVVLADPEGNEFCICQEG